MWSDEYLMDRHGDDMVTVGEIPCVWIALRRNYALRLC